MSSVSVNPPKTPVTKGSNGVAAATIPNVCKMPGPPAPFVPAPLPNIGKSALSPKDYSTSVTIEGNAVAIKGSTFESIGDIASKGTGGGLISANTHGITKFVGPGSMDVKIEGKNVQLLSDPMLNNCAAGGSPPNAATMLGVLQATGFVTAVEGTECPLCGEAPHAGLKETDATKADAGTLSSNYDKRREELSKKHKDFSRPTMLGVVHCKCPKKYADQSGATSQTLCKAADDSGMKHPTGAPDVKARIQAHANNDKVFKDTWQKAEDWHDRSKKDETLPIGYPPGACAAQGALVLCLDDKGLPKAMTEQWYHPKGAETARAIRYIDATDPGGKWVVKDRKFKNGETTPPCASCEIIVELLLCFKEEDKCGH